ncbi:MAG: hypothetical protein IPI49_09645 [Myxococcales bacterium]|nr:hypothetical protein [Myxococcales bacterium]
MWNRQVRLASALTLAVSMSCAAGAAGFVVSGLVAKKVGSDLIEDARNAGAQLLAEGRETANAAIIRAGNELTVAADASARIAGSEANRVVERMSEQNRRLLQGLYDLQSRAASLSRDAFRFKDEAALDLRAMFATLPLVGETFFIQRIEGITQIEQDADYLLEVMGVGLGPDSGDSRSEVRIKIGESMVTDARIERVRAHIASIRIPAARLRPLVADKEVVLVSASFEIKRSTREGAWLWKKWRTRSYSVPFAIALYSRYAGSGATEAKQPRYGWVRVDPERAATTTGNHHCESNCRHERTRTGYSLTIKVPSTQQSPPISNDRRLRKPVLRCISGPCGGWHKVKTVYLSEGNSRATGKFDVWSRPTEWELTAQVESYQMVGETTVPGMFELYYERTTTIEVPAEATFVKISGQLVTKQRFELVVGETITGPVQVTLDTRGQPGPRRITLRAAPPQ